MRQLTLRAFGLLTLLVSICNGSSAFGAAALEGFVETNGVRLQYLDWGGSGPALILIPGMADNPHVFDDVAPAFTDRFHVMAYARRGTGDSEVKGPYDVVTLAEDLRGLLDALDVSKADLVGYSAGGGEITEFAAAHPDRVDRIVYFDGGYDWADPDFKAAVAAQPVRATQPPASAMGSLDAFRAYMKAFQYPQLDDMGRIEANLRGRVIIQADGSLRYKVPKDVVAALYAGLFSNKPRNYKRVLCPALAIYAEHLYDLHVSDVQRRNEFAAFEERYWKPYQEKSIAVIRRELPNLEIAHVPGAHSSFVLTDRQQIVQLTRQFLGASSQASLK